MDLLDRLRPRWRHPDPDVRAAAVRELGRDEQGRLAEVARGDVDARVRRVAIKRLEDAALLESVAQQDADPSLRVLATERLREVSLAAAASNAVLGDCEAALARLGDERSLAELATSAAHAEIRRAALARVSGDRVLRDVVRSATDPAIRREALDRIEDAAVLRAIAVGDGPTDVVVRAVERITDADVLRAVAENRAASKAVRQRARALLPSEAGEAPARAFKEVRARQLELSIAMHALRGATDFLAAADQVREAEREWDDLAGSIEPHPAVAERFRNAVETIRAEAAGSAQHRAEVEHARQTVAESLAARTALCERIETVDGADVPRAIVDARATWSRLAPVPAAQSAALGRRLDVAVREADARHRAWRARQDRRGQLEALLDEANRLADETPIPKAKRWYALEERWNAMAGGEDVAGLASRLADARARLERRRHEAGQQREDLQRENLARLETLCTRVEELTGAEAIKPGAVRRELQAIEEVLVEPGPLPSSERRASWIERLSDLRDRLVRRLSQEEQAEEWRRWANAGAQEEIIGRIEALLDANDLAEGTRQLTTLQDEWARVATASPDKSQALWERFRTARNELRRRCDAYLAENLEKKRALCAEVADVGDATNWNETAELVRRAQAAWKEIGPVPGKHAKLLWQQFREPCDRFFARRKEHFDRLDGERRENASRKTALCEQAEALADSTDWDATTATLKQLQADWKRSGPPPRDQAEVLWQRFRTACDRFFERRSRRGELAREEMTGRAQAICAELEAVVSGVSGGDGPPVDEITRTIDKAWGEWLALDAGLLDDVTGLAARLDAAYVQIAAIHPESFAGTRLDPGVTRKRREKLCARLEELAGATGAAPPRQLSLQEMAQALRDKLATNTIAAGAEPVRGRKQDVGADVQRVVESWARLGPVLDADARELAERFARARARTTRAGER
jgi:hypothetical protein